VTPNLPTGQVDHDTRQLARWTSYAGRRRPVHCTSRQPPQDLCSAQVPEIMPSLRSLRSFADKRKLSAREHKEHRDEKRSSLSLRSLRSFAVNFSPFLRGEFLIQGD
jgi:hypothetical protein